MLKVHFFDQCDRHHMVFFVLLNELLAFLFNKQSISCSLITISDELMTSVLYYCTVSAGGVPWLYIFILLVMAFFADSIFSQPSTLTHFSGDSFL
jgi:hypothetical protein